MTYWALGSQGIVGVEFLTNLDRLPEGAYFLFAPVKIQGCHAPAGQSRCIEQATGDQATGFRLLLPFRAAACFAFGPLTTEAIVGATPPETHKTLCPLCISHVRRDLFGPKFELPAFSTPVFHCSEAKSGWATTNMVEPARSPRWNRR